MLKPVSAFVSAVASWWDLRNKRVPGPFCWCCAVCSLHAHLRQAPSGCPDRECPLPGVCLLRWEPMCSEWSGRAALTSWLQHYFSCSRQRLVAYQGAFNYFVRRQVSQKGIYCQKAQLPQSRLSQFLLFKLHRCFLLNDFVQASWCTSLPGVFSLRPRQTIYNDAQYSWYVVTNWKLIPCLLKAKTKAV